MPNTIHKSNRFSQVFLKKDFKLFPTRRCGLVTSNFILVLLPMEEHPIFKEGDYKRDRLMTLGSSHFEIVLELLTEVVAFHVQVPIIQVRISYFDKSVQGIFLRLLGLWWSGIPAILYECLHKLTEEVILRQSKNQLMRRFRRGLRT